MVKQDDDAFVCLNYLNLTSKTKFRLWTEPRLFSGANDNNPVDVGEPEQVVETMIFRGFSFFHMQKYPLFPPPQQTIKISPFFFYDTLFFISF